LEKTFQHYDLKLVSPPFDSELTNLIIDLDYLRKKIIAGTTAPWIFLQLKHIFHTLESIGSARIEGNNTTIAEYFDTMYESEQTTSQKIIEIRNMENALKFIDDNYKEFSINRFFISELHKMVVENLNPPPQGEGDKTPGDYRKTNVIIAKSNHIPPDYSIVNDYMQELFNFIQKDDQPKFDLLKIALAHHRFVWIHPFTNGNGRIVRLFTYAMLIKQGFHVDVANRILNPTAVFCSNRDIYYDKLSKADSGQEGGLLEWCEYVLTGLKDEIEKVDKLLDYDYLKNKILLPALKFSLERKLITDTENKMLNKVVEKQEIKANDLKEFFPGKKSSEISRKIRNLIQKKIFLRNKQKVRTYSISFDNNYLIRGIMKSLDDNDFLPIKD
jgi:Fic family protein